MINKLIIGLILVMSSMSCTQDKRSHALALGFEKPSARYYPETWFHFMGNNISKEGITLDLEAIKDAGLQGIHLFNKSGRPYPNVDQIRILSPEWEDMIRHTADECARLGLKFTMQNCPGWSMTGGPWVPAEEAQREVVETVYHFEGGKPISKELFIDENYAKAEYDYKDITVLAFPTPKGDDEEVADPIEISSNNTLVPWKRMINPKKQVEMVDRKLPENWKPYSGTGIQPVEEDKTWVKVKFNRSTTVRSLVFPPVRFMLPGTEYPVIDVTVKVEAEVDKSFVEVANLKIPNGNWNDRQYDVTLALPETTSSAFRLTFLGNHVINPGYIYLSPKPRLHNHEPKAFRALRSLQRDVKIKMGEESFVDRSSTIDISDKMDATGKLTWDAPAGKWTVVRFGHVNMRRTNKPAVPEATGWEASKLDKIAIENHLKKGMIGNLMRDGGPIADGKLDGLLIDSWESFIPTWSMHSEDMFREFMERRGYDLKPFLPATMGYIVDSPETTSKFLRDLRHTMDELYVQNFFTHFATIAHEMGAQVYTEGAGGEVLPIDPMRYYGVADIPMTEFWYPSAPSAQNEYAKPIFNAASAMHLYNKPMLAAEACTQVGVQWNEHPFSVKDLIDYNFSKGVNHLVFHTFSHTPQLDVYPGSSFGGNIGFPLVRNQTWWHHMSDWTDYLARNQYMLQQGEYVADVLWYYGDHFERPPFDLDYFPEGYRFDYLNAEILQNNLTVKNGKIKAADAGNYRIIMLRDSRQLMLSTIKKLKELILAGAVILGDKPVDSPSLMDDENDLNELKIISGELWGEGDSGVNAVGKGRIYWGKSIEEVLQLEGIQKDVNAPTDLNINWIHRETENEDIYFVSSRKEESVTLSIGFRIENSAPEIWNAFTGARNEALVWDRDENHTYVAVSLDPKGSAIIVFPKGTKGVTNEKIEWNAQTIQSAAEGWYSAGPKGSLPDLVYSNGAIVASKSGKYVFYKPTGNEEVQFDIKEKSIDSTWNLTFEKGWDTPESVSVSLLSSLTEFDNDAIRHYSGTTTYSTTFSMENTEGVITIDLGEVHHIASLRCNGKEVGTRWAPPYSFDLSEFVKFGYNELEVRITNTWRNQLIYDRQREEGYKKTWTTGFRVSDMEDLDRSGLAGPVTLRTTIIKSKYE